MSGRIELRGSSRPQGVRAAAQLLRAAGPHADIVFAQLTPAETRAIHEQMNHLSTDQHGADVAALEAFLLESAQSPRQDGTAPRADVWSRLTRDQAPILAALVSRESPQVAAWILSQLEPTLAASVVRMLSEDVSFQILRRILNIRAPEEAVCELIEEALEDTLHRVGPNAEVDGHARLARIFDQLDKGGETGLLDKLDSLAPGAADRVRAHMFTFEDLVALDPAGLQTLLSATPRDELVRALKGARHEVANVFYSNLTRRAGASIREDMELLGPIRRSEIEAARASMLQRARGLIETGEILSRAASDDELVE